LKAENKIVIFKYNEPNQGEDIAQTVSVVATGVGSSPQKDAVSVVGKETVPAEQHTVDPQSLLITITHEPL
jgi:hypothetical protein